MMLQGRSLLWCGLLLLLSGCEVDYGDRLLRWVSENGARISSESADSELRMRWAQGHSSQALAARARLSALIDSSASLPHPTPLTTPVSEETLRDHQTQEEQLHDLRVETRSVRESIDAWKSICDNERFFREGQFSKVGDLTRGLPARKSSGPDGVSIGTWDYVVTKLIPDLFLAHQTQEQNDRVDAAIELAARVSISDGERWKKSQDLCKQELVVHQNFIDSAIQSLSRLEHAQALAVEALARRRQELEAQLVPLRIQGREALVAAEWKRQRAVWLAELAEALASVERDRVALSRAQLTPADRLLAEDQLSEKVEHLRRWSWERSKTLGLEQDPDVAQSLKLWNAQGGQQ